ncbi:MAG: hypothetical protein NC131_11150 [Roseburia sp.]|nr:hypothetical protein [Roseburia sp.]
MSKKGKSVEKETRRLMEGVADLVKRKGDGYKFKSKSKKKIKMVKKMCPHWIVRKGKEVPTVVADPEHPGYWRCAICKTRFRVQPEPLGEYYDVADRFLEQLNQLQFWSVKLGGNKEDTQMFLKLRALVPRYRKVAKQIHKRVNQREAWENNRQRSDLLSQFNMYSGFNYNP